MAGLPYLPCSASPRLGAGLRSALAWPLASCYCSAGLALLGAGGRAAAAASPSVHFSIVNNIRKALALYEVKCPLSRLKPNKKLSSNGGRQSLSRIVLQKPTGKILPPPKFCPRENKELKHIRNKNILDKFKIMCYIFFDSKHKVCA